MKEFLPIIMSFFLVLIAYQQWKTNERKRQQDLFNKRWEYYIRLKKLFLDELSSRKILSAADKEIRSNWVNNYSDEGFFLFGKEIEDHIQKNCVRIIERKSENEIENPVKSFRRPFEKYLKIK